MEQLIMRWQNDGKEAIYPAFPDRISVRNWTEMEHPLDTWLDIVQYGLTDTRRDEEYYKQCNDCYAYYKPEDCYFFLLDGCPVGTITVICNPETCDGYVHMVAVTPQARGMGIGNLMSMFAVYLLKTNNMKTAHLTTDDWRIPAIKTYFHSGFFADESTADFSERWRKIREIMKANQMM